MGRPSVVTVGCPTSTSSQVTGVPHTPSSSTWFPVCVTIWTSSSLATSPVVAQSSAELRVGVCAGRTSRCVCVEYT
eukprot:2082258-Rhodomonas_salina.1